jgi:hypothetical protein
LFLQLYTIHGLKYGHVIPVIYGLLPNKAESTYRTFLKAVKDLCLQKYPKSIMMDFEKTAVNVFTEEFANSRLQGCFFHFSQAIYRHVQSAGLQASYAANPEFALMLRHLPALAFVPIQNVQDYFNYLVESSFFEENEASLTLHVNYFEDTWIGRLDRRGRRRPPLFSIEMWNCYEVARKNKSKTNNAVEGWHNSFQSLLQSSKPSIWKLIIALRKDSAIYDVNLEQLIAGAAGQSSKKIYKDTAAKLKRIVDTFQERIPLEFLRGVAHNIQFQM